MAQAGLLKVGALLESTSRTHAEVAHEPTTNGCHSVDTPESNEKEYATSASASINIAEYRPEVTSDGTWLVSEVDCEFLATGCSVLACGGGGPGYNCYLAARAALREGKQMRVVDISTLPDDTLVFGTSTYG